MPPGSFLVFHWRDYANGGTSEWGLRSRRDGRRFAGPCFYGPLAYTFSFNSVQLNPRLQDNLKRRSGAFTEDAVHRARPLLVQMRNISDWIRSHRSQLEALAWLISVVGISLVLLLFVFGPKRIAPIEHGTPTSRREFTSKEPCGPISWRRFDKGKSNSSDRVYSSEMVLHLLGLQQLSEFAGNDMVAFTGALLEHGAIRDLHRAAVAP